MSSRAGSSPLARGLPEQMIEQFRRYGIIPARAGFTPRRARPRSWAGDHPRSRGVYPEAPGMASESWGSSPLARGLRPDRPLRRRPPGIIPARAGFTRRAGRRARERGDHPRSRGVYIRRQRSRAVRAGSSPLARGLPVRAVKSGAAARIIPARAGFTKPRRSHCRTRSDHPRSRGVYFLEMRRSLAAEGSSPLARGLRGAGPPCRPPPRIIPARAGFTA